MSINYYKKEDLISEVQKKIKEVETVLDIGCGIMPQQLTRPLIHICCEPCTEYVEYLKNKVKNEFDREYIIIEVGWHEIADKIPDKTVDNVFLIDVVEHLEKEEGLRLLKKTERIAKKQIIIFTPLGFFPQKHSDGKDAWGLNGGKWQEHKSGWFPNDFDESWDIYACDNFHLHDNMRIPLEEPFGAFWAIKNFSSIERKDERATNHPLFFKNAILCLNSLGIEKQLDELIAGIIIKYKTANKKYQQLNNEHQQLKNMYQTLNSTRAVILARKLGKYPMLKKIISIVYNILNQHTIL
jgi:hypothetical protein